MQPPAPLQSKYLCRQSLQIREFSAMEASQDMFSEEQLNYTSSGNDTSEWDTGEEELRTVDLFLGKDYCIYSIKICC